MSAQNSEPILLVRHPPGETDESASGAKYIFTGGYMRELRVATGYNGVTRDQG